MDEARDGFPELDRLKELCTRLRGSTAPEASGELVLLGIKGASRGVHQHIEETKSKSDAEKANFDANSLQLHNLLYEKHHYQREIARCADFRSKHEDVGLVDRGTFEAEAPAELRRAGPEEAHQLMVDRLEFELLERQRLAREQGVLVARKAELSSTVKSKAGFLRELPAHLAAMRASSAPLQQALVAPVSVARQQHEAARSLPAPLYVVFAQLEAFRDTAAPTASVEISGHVADAEAWYKVRKEAGSGSVGGSPRPARDATAEAVEEGADDKDGEGRRSSKRLKPDDGNAEHAGSGAEGEDGVEGDDDGSGSSEDVALAPMPDVFPLVVSALVPGCKGGGSLRVSFSYAPSIAAVLVDAEHVSVGGIKDVEIRGARLLSTLFEGDGGLAVPQQAGANSPAGRWDPSRRSRPYRWAQFLAGLPMASDASDTDQQAAWQAASARASAGSVQSAVERMVGRIDAQLALREQLRCDHLACCLGNRSRPLTGLLAQGAGGARAGADRRYTAGAAGAGNGEADAVGAERFGQARLHVLPSNAAMRPRPEVRERRAAGRGRGPARLPAACSGIQAAV